MVANQPLVIGGGKKTLKTSIMIDLVVSLVTGTQFLSYFAVPRKVRVGVISGESGGATIRDCVRRVCRERKVSNPELLNAHWLLEMPALSDAADLATLRQQILDLKLQVVIIDPLYLCLLRGNASAQATNMYDMGPLLSNICQICLQAGATPILVHHFRKGGQAYKRGPNAIQAPPELDDLAFAGIGEYARQWLLVGRRKMFCPASGLHELWLSVGGSAGHFGIYGVNIREGVMSNDFRGRVWKVTTRSYEAQLAHDKRHVEVQKQEQQQTKESERRERVLAVLRRAKSPLSKTSIRDQAEIGNTSVRQLLENLEQEQVIRRVRNQREVRYQLVTHSDDSRQRGQNVKSEPAAGSKPSRPQCPAKPGVKPKTTVESVPWSQPVRTPSKPHHSHGR